MDTDFKEKIKKNNDMGPQEVWSGIFSPVFGHANVAVWGIFLGQLLEAKIIKTRLVKDAAARQEWHADSVSLFSCLLSHFSIILHQSKSSGHCALILHFFLALRQFFLLPPLLQLGMP